MITEILMCLPDYTFTGEIERFRDAGDVYAPRHLHITPGTRTARVSA